jgi:hypothetical protein
MLEGIRRRRFARRAYREMFGWAELLHVMVIDRRIDHTYPKEQSA